MAFTKKALGRYRKARTGRDVLVAEPARLRIPKSSISRRSFSFQKAIHSRGENAIFRDPVAFTTRESKRRHSTRILAQNSSQLDVTARTTK